MNKIRVNHHEMNYILITGIWLTVHILFAAAMLVGCYKIDEGAPVRCKQYSAVKIRIR